jgi:hypothetical protein
MPSYVFPNHCGVMTSIVLQNTNRAQGPAPNEPFFTKRLRVLHDLGDLSKPNVPAKLLELTQRIGSHRLTVYASEFVPSPGDVVSYKWTDRSGELHELQMPFYCLTNVAKIHHQICEYITAAKLAYLASVKTDDELAWLTISAAMDYSQQNPVSHMGLISCCSTDLSRNLWLPTPSTSGLFHA